jgi:hypothetical protein
MTLDDVIKQISEIEECKFQIYIKDPFGPTNVFVLASKAYIIY